jgi:uncharacterized membrane-anchored protein
MEPMKPPDNRILSLRMRKTGSLPGITAVARIDRRTKTLTKRLQPGEVAIIDHVDLDWVSAQALVACGAAAVINVASGISGRYPNLGPQIIIASGCPFVDKVTPALFARVKDGDVVRVHEGAVYLQEELVGIGRVQTAASIEAAMAKARAGLSAQIQDFVTNTMEYVRRESPLLIDGVGVPGIRTYHYKEDLATLRPYIRDNHPVLIGVDGGADALLEAGYLPDLIVGDFDSVSEAALTCGAELVVHAFRDGRAPGMERVHELGRQAVLFPAAAMSEDIAILLADEKGAELIVAVGTHATVEEFFDKGRAGMASTLLTRLRVGSKLVDAKGVSRLYRSRISWMSLLVLVITVLITLCVALSVTPVGRIWATGLLEVWNDFSFWLIGRFS